MEKGRSRNRIAYNRQYKDLTLLTLKTMCTDLYDCYMKQVPEMMIENYDEEKREWEGLL